MKKKKGVARAKRMSLAVPTIVLALASRRAKELARESLRCSTTDVLRSWLREGAQREVIRAASAAESKRKSAAEMGLMPHEATTTKEPSDAT